MDIVPPILRETRYQFTEYENHDQAILALIMYFRQSTIPAKPNEITPKFKRYFDNTEKPFQDRREPVRCGTTFRLLLTALSAKLTAIRPLTIQNERWQVS